MPLPPSLLKQVLNDLPDNWKMKKESVIPLLKKKGVKDEELKASGLDQASVVTIDKDFAPATHVTKKELLNYEDTFRLDIHTFKEGAPGVGGTDKGITIPGSNLNSYRVNTRHVNPGAWRAPDWPTHFPERGKDVVWHTRTTNENIGGWDTRLVQEIQSDLHQKSRKATSEEYQKSLPFVKNWTRKAIEQEVLSALEKDQNAIGVVLDTDIFGANTLVRSEGAEQFYTSTVRNTLKKLAKQLGGSYKEVPRSSTPNRPKTSEEAKSLINATSEGDYPLIGYLENDVLPNRPIGETPESYLINNWNDFTSSDYFETYFGDAADTVIGKIEFGERTGELAKKFKLFSASGTAITAGTLTPEEEARAENFIFEPSQVNEALKQGLKIDEIRSYLDEKGADPIEVQSAIDVTILEKVRLAEEQGIEVDDIKEYMTTELGMQPDEVNQFIEENAIGVTPTGAPGPGDMPISTEISPEPLEFTPEKLTSKYRSLHQKYATLGKSVAGLGIENFAEEALKDQVSLAGDIVTGLNKHGVQAEAHLNTEGFWPTYDIVVQGKDGPQVLESDFFEEIGNTQHEIMGAISMAATAAKVGGHFFPNPIIKGLLTGTGAAVGAAAGRVLDIHTLAKATKELDNIKSKFYIEQMIDAGVADATFGVLGTTALKAGVGLGKLVGGAFDLAMRGNLNGAYKALKDHVGMDDTQVQEIIKEWEKVTGTKAPGLSKKTKAIHVLPQVVPGAEDIAGQAGQINPRVGATIVRSINDRARNVLNAADNMTNDNVGVVLQDDLGKYVDNVKNYYGGIKNHAVDAMAESDYRFNYDELTLEPLFQRIEKNIQNPAVLDNFQKRLERVRAIGRDLPEEPPRTFADLLDLVKVVNEFGFNKRISGHGNFEAIKEIQGLLKEEVKKTVTEHMPKGDTWLVEWKKANREYSKMLSLRDNVMFKALTKKGVNVEKVVNTLVKDVKSIDGTFMQVMGKLPAKTRSLAEGAIMNKLVKNNTVGSEGGLRAVHFPNLQKDLANVGFTSPETRDMKRAIGQLANVFRNDVNVFRSTGQISGAKFTSYLTFDPVVRLKFAVANQSFNFFRKLLPGAKGEATALISKASKVLENPANARAIEDLIKALPNDPELISSVKQLAIEYAKFGYPEHYPKVKVYRTTVPGRTAKAIDGRLGKGTYWTTNKDTAKVRSKATGAKIISEKINPARIASMEDVNRIMGREVDPKELKTNPEIINKLKEEFFLGISINEDMAVFK